jgi:NAD(P)-dependent dehydrogenase (short-subunit alcohol dehydrogenase family)
MRLQDKRALVTGGGSGLGRVAALAMAKAGAAVTVVDINAEGGEAAVHEIRAAGGKAVFARADVTVAAQCEAAVLAAEAAFGPLNTALINAAVQMVGHDARAHELSEATWDKTHAINLKGMWLTGKYVLASMLRAGGGSLILTGSPTGLNGAAGFTAYASSKAGSYALARTIAADYARDNIRCNVLVPGPMETPLTASLFSDKAFADTVSGATMLGRIGKAHEIAGLVVFLASDESTYCTGGYFMADGGITAL